MKRDALDALIAWKKDVKRKPLIVHGARQVGKTWLLKEFGKQYFGKTIYINFEDAPELQGIFRDYDTSRIIRELQIYAQTQIEASDTLIIFDEIQSVKRGLNSLKYFCEDAPQHAITAAESLLGMHLHAGESFPVGKVNFLDLKPLSFFEFLRAVGKDILVDTLEKKEFEYLQFMHAKLVELLRIYLFVGGMPEVVLKYSETQNLQAVRNIQQEIIRAYRDDFSKHVPYELVPRLQMVWNSMPTQLAKENKKFVYGVIREGGRSKDYELAIQWLCDCGLLLKCYRIEKPALPLVGYQNLSIFKLFLVDVGLLSALSYLDARTIIKGDSIFTEYKGALTEQFVMQELSAAKTNYIGYWTNDRSTAEVDFVIQQNADVCPIEVKAETNVRAKSFKFFCEKYQPQKAYRLSLLPFHKEDWMTNVPLYGAAVLPL